MERAVVAKWGDGLAVRIPRKLAEQAGIKEGDIVTLDVQRDSVQLRSGRRRYELSELVAQITPENRHSETGWGRPVGKEQW